MRQFLHINLITEQIRLSIKAAYSSKQENNRSFPVIARVCLFARGRKRESHFQLTSDNLLRSAHESLKNAERTLGPFKPRNGAKTASRARTCAYKCEATRRIAMQRNATQRRSVRVATPAAAQQQQQQQCWWWWRMRMWRWRTVGGGEGRTDGW